MPQATIAVLDGNKQAPHTPKKYKGVTVRTLWSELAWQLGGKTGYERVRQADESGTSPGKEILADLLRSAYPIHPEVFDRLYEEWSSLDNF